MDAHGARHPALGTPPPVDPVLEAVLEAEKQLAAYAGALPGSSMADKPSKLL
jgi:hypothetical protein